MAGINVSEATQRLLDKSKHRLDPNYGMENSRLDAALSSFSSSSFKHRTTQQSLARMHSKESFANPAEPTLVVIWPL